MGRPPKSMNKPKAPTTEMDEPTSQGEVAVFQPPRLPFHPAVEERFGVDRGQWKVLVEAIFPAAKTADAIVMVLSYCKTRGLDPFKRPVHIVPVYDSARGAYIESVWPGISELRTTASRTKGYAGCDVAEFGDLTEMEFKGRIKRNGNWIDETVTVEFPEWCRITVYRIVDGQRCKFVGPKVSWLESYATQGASDLPNKMWQERPEGQLEKCAEAAALRRAFPEELGNELTAEEMIGRNIHDLVVDTTAIDVSPNRDAAPPRQVAPPQDELPPDVEAATEVEERTPPPRPPKEAPKEDPISSGPPRTPPAKAKPVDDTPKPHRIPGNGHTYESWAERYCDLIKTSPDKATLYAWIDANTKEFVDPNDQTERKQQGPLKRLEAGRPSAYATVHKTTQQLMTSFDDAIKKAAEKAAKAAPPPNEMDGPDMFDGPSDDARAAATQAPPNPDQILKQIDAELSAVEDPEQLQTVWDSAVEPLLKDLFPPDVDEAQALFNKHEKRLGGD